MFPVCVWLSTSLNIGVFSFLAFRVNIIALQLLLPKVSVLSTFSVVSRPEETQNLVFCSVLEDVILIFCG